MSETRTAEMKCEELVELVTAYLEGALPAAGVARFESHVEGCDGCSDYVEQMRVTIAALGHLPAESLSAEAEEKLLAAFAGWREWRPYGAP